MGTLLEMTRVPCILLLLFSGASAAEGENDISLSLVQKRTEVLALEDASADDDQRVSAGSDDFDADDSDEDDVDDLDDDQDSSEDDGADSDDDEDVSDDDATDVEESHV